MLYSLNGPGWLGQGASLLEITTVIVPVDIVWPFAVVSFHVTAIPFFVVARLASTMFITAANVFLQYKVAVSNRKAKENERLDNEEEKRHQNLDKLLCPQFKHTITLLLVGGIDVIGNMFTYVSHSCM